MSKMTPEEIKKLRLKMIESHRNSGALNCRGAPRLKAMAKYIDAVFPMFEVSMRQRDITKTTKAAGMRYTTGGGTRTYTGNKLEVYFKGDRRNIVFDHDATEAYRTNCEVVDWILSTEYTMRSGKTMTIDTCRSAYVSEDVLKFLGKV